MIIQSNNSTILMPMLKFLKPKSYINAYKDLSNSGIFQSDFSRYEIKGIISQILYDGQLFGPLTQVLKDLKLNPLLVLKIQLLMHHLLQVNQDMQQNEDLFQLLLELSVKVKKMINSTTNSKSNHLQSEDNFTSGKRLKTQNDSSACQDGTALLLIGVIQPLLELQKRLVFSSDLIYSQQDRQMDLNQCWAVLNLLKKFVSISPQIESIGRYYSKEYATAMICLIKVMDSDIQLLYKRIKDYASNRINQYEELFDQDRLSDLPDDQNIRMKQFLQLVEEIEAVNQNIQKLYNSKYFTYKLACHHIVIPNLFTTQEHLGLLYSLQKRTFRKNSSTSCASKETRIQSEGFEEI